MARSLRQARQVGRHPLRRTSAIMTSMSAIIGTGLVAGPATAVTGAAECLLPRTDAHHSEGVDTWNDDYVRPERELDALMVFLSFPDWKPFVSPSALVADHFPATSDFFARASYDRFRLRVHPLREWLEMPAASTAYGIQRDWDPGLRTAFLQDALAAADRRVDFADYDVYYLVADPDAPGVNSDATKVVNFDEPMVLDGAAVHRVVTVFEQHPPDRYVLAHETGHVFDLPDLYHRPGEGKGDWDTHVGDWDVMGSQFGLAPDLFGWHKWKLGWLDRWNVACVAGESGTTRYALRALGAPLEPGRRDTRLLVLRTGPYEALALEGRAPAGNDAGVCTGGVLLYRVRSDTASADGPVEVLDGHPRTSDCLRRSVYPPLADAPLREGETYVTEDGGGIRIRIGEGGPGDGGWQVRVTRGPEALE
ncbi:M6 family metalloprotease domain-containing protein [Streptomyces sp. JJ36]|uniref:M6 family metalloprotease domain-containing protein n=1 Tax=Streptomyces sp. JJ36 TaxID=2736645 RepID=UPI001F012060|nr:M6 family metalloprotease domain-containing protein [Streptomyces sp. JJ36]MCF6526004.1 M6 family metalloprotease domain-containing protein [Streptomyces sp. JJ36]